MKQTKLFIIVFSLVLSLVLTACEGAPTAEEPTAAPAEIAEEPPAIEPTPTQEPTEIPCMIVFDSDRDNNKEIYVMGPDGSSQTNLTNNGADDFDPVWSPDGKAIAFVSNRESDLGGGQFIYTMAADGSGVRQLSTLPDSKMPDWSPEGSQIAFNYHDDIYVINTDGSGETNLTNSPEQDEQPKFSLDGQLIAWISRNGNDSSIFVMNTDGSNPQQVTHGGEISDLEWTVDGRIFTHWDNPDGICFNCLVSADGSEVVDAGGKGAIQEFLPFWMLDGQKVEMISGQVPSVGGEDDEIYLVGEIFPDIFLNLTDNEAQDRNPDTPALCGPVESAQAPIEPQTSVEPQKQPVRANPQKDPKDLVIGFADYKGIFPKRVENFNTACAELGIQCVEGDGFELIAQGVDAIVANTDPFAVSGLHPLVMEARDKGILIFVLDAESSSDGAYSVTISEHEWAKTGLGWILEGMGGCGEFVYFNRHADSAYTSVIEDMLLRYPEVKVLAEFDGKYEGLDDYQRMEADVAELANAHPDLKGIWASESMMNVLWGLKGSQRPISDWPRFLCEPSNSGLSIWKQMQSEDASFECFALLNPDGIAYDAVYIAYYMLTGMQLKEYALEGANSAAFYLPLPFVNNDNLEEWWQQVEGASPDEHVMLDAPMRPEEIRARWFVD